MLRFREKLTNFFSLSKSERNFKDLARTLQKKYYRSDGVILVEKRYWAFDILSLLHFLPFALSFYNARPITYEILTNKPFLRLKNWIRHKFSTQNAISSSAYLLVATERFIKLEHNEIAREITSMHMSKKEFEKFEYKGIRIGDLIYDEFLRKKSHVTLDFDSQDFLNLVISFLQFCDKFMAIFAKEEIKAVIVSHPVYRYALPARIANQLGIDAFLVDQTNLVKLNSTYQYGGMNLFSELSEQHKQFSKGEIIQNRHVARDRLSNRIEGNTVDLGLPERETAGAEDLRVQLKNLKEKEFALIALHDFHDAAHSYGGNFYPDFSIWVESVGRCTMGSNFIFLIKPHPFARATTEHYMKDLLGKFPHFMEVSSFLNIKDFASVGVKYCLTVFGSIAHEAPALGITVINASINNPHKDFNFSYTPKDVTEYELILRSLSDFDYKHNLDSLYDYYFLRFVNRPVSWFLPDYADFIKSVGTPWDSGTAETLNYFIDTKKKLKWNELEVAILRYLSSEKLFFNMNQHLEDPNTSLME